MRSLVLCLVALFAAGNSLAASFRFAILGDRTGEAVPGVYERVWQDVAAEHPAFALSVGDTIQGGNDATAAAEWRQLRPIWKRAAVPVFFCPGNHDVWSNASARTYERETRRPLSYSFDWQNAHFTVLDNSRTEELAPDQLVFLERDLARTPAASLRFVVVHRPFWLIYLKLRNTDFPLHRIARKYGVTAVLSGHMHQYDRIDQDGIIYLMVCSSGGHLRTSDGGEDAAHGWFFGHVLATVDGRAVSFEVKRLNH